MFICDATNKKRTNIFFRTISIYFTCVFMYLKKQFSVPCCTRRKINILYIFAFVFFFSSCLSNVLQIKILIQVERFIVKGFHYRNHRSTSVLKTGSGLRQPSFTAGASPLQTLSFFAVRSNHRCTFFFKHSSG